MFRALPCSSSGRLRRNCIYHPLVSSLLVYLSCLFSIANLNDWLTVHRSITLVDLQLDAQNSCLFTYNTFIKILYMFRALPCSTSGGLRRNCIYAASGIVIQSHRSSFLTGTQDSHLQRVTIPEAAYIQLRSRPPDDERGDA